MKKLKIYGEEGHDDAEVTLRLVRDDDGINLVVVGDDGEVTERGYLFTFSECHDIVVHSTGVSLEFGFKLGGAGELALY